MSTDNLLSSKIVEVKNAMQGYRSLPEYSLDGVGAALTSFSRPREKHAPFLPPNVSWASESDLPSYWLNGLIIAVLTVLSGWLVSLITGEAILVRDISVSVWVAAVGALALIVNKINIRTFWRPSMNLSSKKLYFPMILMTWKVGLKETSDLFYRCLLALRVDRSWLTF